MAQDPNTEILTASEFTVTVAKKELGKTLDYSISSLKDLETLIQLVKSQLLNLKRDGKLTEQTVQRASISIGGYLGEVIRRSKGGSWIAKNAIMKSLIINGQEFFPIHYAFQRLTKDLDYGTENYLSDINQKLSPRAEPENILVVSEATKKTTNSLTKNRGLIIGGILGVIVLCIIGISVTRVYSNIKATNESKVKINNFLVEANKLDLMTEQGVTYQEFRTQLIEVKSTFSAIDYWPFSYWDGRQAFDKALEGWDLTLKAWGYGLDQDTYLNLVYLPENGSLLEECTQYVGAAPGSGTFTSVDDWIGFLMGQASTYLEAGKAEVK